MFRTIAASLIIQASLSLTASAAPVPVEDSAYISKTPQYTREKMLSMAELTAQIARAKGWRCDSIQTFRPFLFSDGFTLRCNGGRYEYELVDRGGKWILSLK